MPAKLEVSSVNRSRDMEGYQNSKIKVSHMTPLQTHFDLLLNFCL